MASRHVKQKYVASPVFSAAQLDSEATSSEFSAQGYAQAALHVSYTYGAGTALTITVEGQAGPDDTTWRVLQVDDLATVPTITLADAAYSEDGAADDAWIVPNIPIAGCYNVRFKASCAGVPTTSDLITARLVLVA